MLIIIKILMKEKLLLCKILDNKINNLTYYSNNKSKLG